jgi:hypothetical protein
MPMRCLSRDSLLGGDDASVIEHLLNAEIEHTAGP